MDIDNLIYKKVLKANLVRNFIQDVEKIQQSFAAIEREKSRGKLFLSWEEKDIFPPEFV